jgi:hypothetical protein
MASGRNKVASEAGSTFSRAHQFRTRNDLIKTQRTRSNSNENAAKSTKLIHILPLITVWLQVRVLPGPPAFAREASEGCRAKAHRAKAGRAARELRLGKPRKKISDLSILIFSTPPEIPTGSGTISAQITKSSQGHLRQAGRARRPACRSCRQRKVSTHDVRSMIGHTLVTSAVRKYARTRHGAFIFASPEAWRPRARSR